MRISQISYCVRLAALVTIFYFVTQFFTHLSNEVIQTLQTNSHRSMTSSKNIVLVIVVCPPPGDFTPRDEAAVLLKSIIISGKFNSISTIEVHLFVENIPREEIFFRNKIKEFGYPFLEFVLLLHFHSAVNAVPSIFQNEFIYETDYKKLLRCTNVRLFIPSALPKVDAVLYFDTDIVIHGNLAELWNTWNLMDNEQLSGVGSNYEEGSALAERFKDDLYPPPRFLNPGVMLMNLTRMRSFGWERKALTIWSKYKTKIRNINDQDHCTPNALCKTANTSSVQIIHGAGGYFGRPNALQDLFLTYQGMNIHNLNFNSKDKLRAFVLNSLNYFPYSDSICYEILSDIIK